MYAEQMLKCTSCTKLKSESEFYNYKHEHKCKSCMSEHRKASYAENPGPKLIAVQTYRVENPDKIKNTKLKQAYGLTLKEFNEKLVEQDYKCAICRKPETAVRKGKLLSLAVDHRHADDKNRGLLCMKCNRALGLLNENTDVMQNMIEYTNKHLK